MSICNGCNGIIGRDCFNPVECEQISREIEQDINLSVEIDIRDQHIKELEMQVVELHLALKKFTVLNENEPEFRSIAGFILNAREVLKKYNFPF